MLHVAVHGSKGGATFLKVGGGAHSASRKFFCTPHFLASGGTTVNFNDATALATKKYVTIFDISLSLKP